MLCRLRLPFLSHPRLWRTLSLSTFSTTTGGTPPSYQPSSHVISETEAFNNEMAAVFGGAPSTSTMDNDSRGEQQQEHQTFSPSTVSSHQQHQQKQQQPDTPGTPVTITVPSVGDGQAVNIHLHFHSSVGNITVNYIKR